MGARTDAVGCAGSGCSGRDWNGLLLCSRLFLFQDGKSLFSFVNRLALAAAYPALRNAQLVVHDFERGTATGAMGDITHGVSL